MSQMNNMLCNAMNNGPFKDSKKVCFPRNMVEQITASLGRHGYTVVALEDVSKEDLIDAMTSYRLSTDWSAFSKKDWVDAFATLGE